MYNTTIGHAHYLQVQGSDLPQLANTYTPPNKRSQIQSRKPRSHSHPTAKMSMNPPAIKPEIVDHNYALSSRDEDTDKGDQSSSDSNSSDSSSSSESDTEGVVEYRKGTEQKDTNVSVSTPIVPADGASGTKSSSRVRTPPDKYVDLFAVTPKGSPSGHKSPKRLSTSVKRKAKEPLRKRQTRSEGGSTLIAISRFPRKLKRGKGCGECEPCNREDCGKCVHCLDKVKFGGPGKRKQKCTLRVCVNMVSKRKRNDNSVSKPRPIIPKTVSYIVLNVH